MKIALIILGGLAAVVLIAVLTLLIMGQRKGARHLEATIEIDRTPDVVFDWVTQPEYTKQWVSWLVEIEDLTPEVEGLGARSEWHMDDPNMNKIIKMTSEVTAYEENQYVEVKIAMDGGFTGTTEYTLTDLGNGRTRLTNVGDYEYEPWFANLMEPLVTPAARKKLNGDFARLKELAEAAPEPSSS